MGSDQLADSAHNGASWVLLRMQEALRDRPREGPEVVSSDCEGEGPCARISQCTNEPESLKMSVDFAQTCGRALVWGVQRGF